MRAVNFVGALLALLLLSPVLLVCYLAVKILSPGPVLFRQVREGYKGQSFTVYKLRTMHVDSSRMLEEFLRANEAAREEWASRRALADDPRVIPWIGAWMRRLSMDEIPQFWNILRGDMALVGPRPFELPVVEQFPSKYRALRSSVCPGITGLFQVSGRKKHDMKKALAFDIVYVRHRSLLLDLSILARTPQAVLGSRGAG